MIYLDHNATTTTHPAVQSLMQELFGLALNPSSIHANGRHGKKLIEHARSQVASLLGINARGTDYQVIFTASGTEANNLLLANFAEADIFISAIEHLSILQPASRLPNVKFIEVDSNGVVELDALAELLSQSNKEKKLVSVMLANNETGVLQPIQKIAEIAKKFGASMHSDCVQGVGKVNVNLPELGVDFATISGHKFGAPLGSAALIAPANYPLKANIIGGGQERGLRSGSENVPAIAGFGLAAELAAEELQSRQVVMQRLRDRLEQNLPENSKIVAKDALRLPNTSLITTLNIEAATQVIALDLAGILLSSGAACSSGKVSSSHVLKAMNLSEEEQRCAIRVSLSHNNTEKEIDQFIATFKEKVGISI